MIVMQLPVQQEVTPVGLDEVALVRAAQSDLSLFTELYQRYARQVYRYLLVRIGNEADAQDATSQTFLAAMQGLGSYRGQQPFAAWLFGIARLKQLPGKNIGVAGSPTLVRSLLQDDLLDELTLMIHPVVVGSGKRLFKEGDALKRLKPIYSKTTGSGVQILVYQPADQ